MPQPGQAPPLLRRRTAAGPPPLTLSEPSSLPGEDRGLSPSPVYVVGSQRVIYRYGK